METDVCLKRAGRAIILDTKFYSQALKVGLFGDAKLDPSNLYQLFTYLRQGASKPGWEHAEGILLYPRTTRDVAVEFTTQGHRIRALTLNLARPWKSIHGELMRIVVGDQQADDFGVLTGLSDI
jgi:5-methylcytosine-specific restriction enzyme subunit McrC